LSSLQLARAFLMYTHATPHFHCRICPHVAGRPAGPGSVLAALLARSGRAICNCYYSNLIERVHDTHPGRDFLSRSALKRNDYKGADPRKKGARESCKSKAKEHNRGLKRGGGSDEGNLPRGRAVTARGARRENPPPFSGRTGEFLPDEMHFLGGMGR